jgi:hypothetical protein
MYSCIQNKNRKDFKDILAEPYFVDTTLIGDVFVLCVFIHVLTRNHLQFSPEYKVLSQFKN